jgi:hypothetical protein
MNGMTPWPPNFVQSTHANKKGKTVTLKGKRGGRQVWNNVRETEGFCGPTTNFVSYFLNSVKTRFIIPSWKHWYKLTGTVSFLLKTLKIHPHTIQLGLNPQFQNWWT